MLYNFLLHSQLFLFKAKYIRYVSFIDYYKVIEFITNSLLRIWNLWLIELS